MNTKYYILNERNSLLLADGHVLEFNTRNDAEGFLARLKARDSMYTSCFVEGSTPVEAKRVDASNCMPFFYSDDGDVMLVNFKTGKIKFM